MIDIACPGGATIVAEDIVTGEVTRGTAELDGSFELEIDSNRDAVVEVTVSSGGESSGAVYVTRGGAMVGSGNDDALSCMQRSQLASQAIGSVISTSDTSCQTAADCTLVPYRTSCTDVCDDALVFKAAESRIEAAIQSIDDGLCADFAADGCNVIALPCVPWRPGPIMCVSGKCEQLPADVEPVCSTCFDRALRWGPANGTFEYSLSGCDQFSRTAGGQVECSGSVPRCDTDTTGATVDAVLRALEHPDVEAALDAGGTVGGTFPAPGGLSLEIQLGDRSFVIINCSGVFCSPVPSGVAALQALLEELADVLGCEDPSCPPNRRWVTDVCFACGPFGGCGAQGSGCAIVCSDSSQCTQPQGEMWCSSRGICEASLCI